METSNPMTPLPRMAQRCRSWAELAADRAYDDGADIEQWHSVSRRLFHAADLYEGGHDDQAAAVIDGVIGDLLRSGR